MNIEAFERTYRDLGDANLEKIEFIFPNEINAQYSTDIRLDCINHSKGSRESILLSFLKVEEFGLKEGRNTNLSILSVSYKEDDGKFYFDFSPEIAVENRSKADAYLYIVSKGLKIRLVE